MLFFNLKSNENKPDTRYELYISQIAGGDKQALASLYEQTKSAVYGYALSIVQNIQDAEDILQDTFVSVYASAGSYQKMGKPMAWILTITKNFAFMKIRNRQKTADISEDTWNLFLSEDSHTKSEDRILLHTALKTISQEESQIILLHAVAGFKHREIAAFLNLPLSTVLSKYNRAIKKLKVSIEGE